MAASARETERALKLKATAAEIFNAFCFFSGVPPMPIIDDVVENSEMARQNGKDLLYCAFAI
jgi:hypothetical protein